MKTYIFDGTNTQTFAPLTVKVHADSPTQAVLKGQQYCIQAHWSTVRECDDSGSDQLSRPSSLFSWGWVLHSGWSDVFFVALLVGLCGAVGAFELWASFGNHGPSAGVTAPAIAHVSVGSGGNLKPDVGYEWAGGPELQVRWVGGKRYAALPHIVSSSREGNWDVDPGYVLVPGPHVRWVPGQPLRGHPHVIADAIEGRWSPEVGYEFASTADLAVRLKPATSGPDHASVAAAGEAGALHKSASAITPVSPAARHRTPTQDQLTRAFFDVAFAAGEHALSRPRPDDGFLAAGGRDLMRAARDATFNDALHNLFPDRSPMLLNAAGRLLTLGIDGKLTMGNWASATARDVIVGELRKYDPADADVIDIADFIVKAVVAYNSH